MSLLNAILGRRAPKPCVACGHAPHSAHAAKPASAKPAKGRRRRAPLAQYRDDPVAFVRDVLPDAGAPYDKQVEMMRLVAKQRRVSVVGCNGSGKDWAIARLILWYLETRIAAKIVVIAPTQRQIEHVLWQELATAVDNASIPLAGKLTVNRYTIAPDCFAIAFSTNNPDNITGFHSPELMLIIDEAHGVSQDKIDAGLRLNPTKTVMLGNALPRPGEFYDSHHGKQNAYSRLRISAYDTPNLQEGAERIPGLITQEDIDDKALLWGEDHPLFRSSVLALFPDADDNSLVGRKAVEDAMRADAPIGEGAPSEEEDAREPVYIGVDVARFGDDKSVLVARRGQRVIATKELPRDADTMRVAGEAALMIAELGAEAVFVDENGVGGGVCDRLREIGAPVYGVQFGRRAPHPTRFANLRSEIFWELRRLMNDRLIALPQDDDLESQLLSLRYDVASAGQVRLESKRETRKKGIPSPDRADALALAFLRPPSLQIWTGNEPFLRDRLRARAGIRLSLQGERPPPTAAGEGTGRAPPADALDNDIGADGGAESRLSLPPPSFLRRQEPPPTAAGEGTGSDPPDPAPPDTEDAPLDRHFIRF